MSPDPLDALRRPLAPLAPDPAFAEALRARLERAVADAGLTDRTPARPAAGAPEPDPDRPAPARATDEETTMPRSDVPTTEDPTRATDPAPGAGLRPLVPYLTCSPAREAIAWYGQVLGAEVVGEIYPMGPDSDDVGHAELRIGDGTLYLSDEYAPVGAISPRTAGAATTAFVVEVADVDAAYARAVAAGAIADRPPSDESYGARSGWFTDPFGHRWSFQTPTPPT